jgi:valyl-tRNA synthetase
MYNFIWKDYCDWYIEFSKSRIYGSNDSDREIVTSMAVFILKTILKLLHPYAPFITEEIWSYFKSNNESILLNSDWPQVNNQLINKKNEEDFSFIMQCIVAIRNMRSELNISPKKEAELICRGEDSKTKLILQYSKYFSSLVKIPNISSGKNIKKPPQSSTAVINDVELFLPLSNLIDIDIEVKRLQVKIADIKGRIRAVRKKIDNKNFIQNAPVEIVNHEKNKYNSYKKDYEKLINNLNNLN